MKHAPWNSREFRKKLMEQYLFNVKQKEIYRDYIREIFQRWANNGKT